MGASSSQVKVLNETINKTTIEVFNKTGAKTSSVSKQGNEFEILGDGNKITNFNQSNKSAINMTAIVESTAKGNLQSDLKAALNTKLKQQAQSLGMSIQDTQINNIVSNSVNAIITNESVTEMKSLSEQANKAKISGSNNIVDGFIQSNESAQISKIAQTLSTDILVKAGVDATIVNDVTQTAPSVIDSIGNIFGSFGMLIPIIGLAGGAFLIYKFSPLEASPGKIKLIIGIIIVIVVVLTILLIYYKVSKPKSSSFSNNKDFCENCGEYYDYEDN